MKKITALLLAALLCLSLCACGSSLSLSDSEGTYYEVTSASYGTGLDAASAKAITYQSAVAVTADSEEVYTENTSDTAEGSDSSLGRKLIWTAALYLQTKDLDTAAPALEQLVTGFGGYVQSSSISGTRGEKYSSRCASYTLRIPADQLNDFLEGAGAIGNVLSRSLSSKDVTLDYTDTESRVKALEAQRDALLEMLEKAEELEDLLTIRDHLSDVEYELENYASQLRTYDNQIDYATVSLDLSEVVDYTVSDPGFGEELLTTFKNSLEGVGGFFTGLAIFLLGNLPALLVIAAFGVLIFLGIRRLVRKGRAKRQARKAKRAESLTEAPRS